MMRIIKMGEYGFVFVISLFTLFSCRPNKNNGPTRVEITQAKEPSVSSTNKNVEQGRIEIIADIKNKSISIKDSNGIHEDDIPTYEYMDFWKENIVFFSNGSILGKLPINNNGSISTANPYLNNYEAFYIDGNMHYTKFAEGKGYELFISSQGKYQKGLILISKRIDSERKTRNSLLLINDLGEIQKEYSFELGFSPDSFEVQKNNDAINFAVYSMDYDAYYYIDQNTLELNKIKEIQNVDGH
jgi:hypothetical protein